MKIFYLAKDKDGDVWGYSNPPVFKEGTWWDFGNDIYNDTDMMGFGLDVTKFDIDWETPIKVRPTAWEEVAQ